MAPFRRVDLLIRELADRHGGHVSRDQLRALGLSIDAIKHRIATGFLIPVFRGVYAVGHIPTHPHDRARGALLAVGREAALSHGSAAALWGIWKEWHFPLEMSTPLNRRPSGLIVHHNKHLTGNRIATHWGIRVTSPAMTVLDLAPRLTGKRLQRAIDDLRMPTKFVTLEQLEAIAIELPHHRGARRLRRVLGISMSEPTRSPWEQDWPPFAKRYGLPAYEMNAIVGGDRVDVLFAAERVVVELDGWEAHNSYDSFVADRARDASLLADHGISTVRITKQSFRKGPAEEARRLRLILTRRVRDEA